jgi:hypothetical protein
MVKVRPFPVPIEVRNFGRDRLYRSNERRQPTAIKMTDGQKVTNAKSPGPIGFGLGSLERTMIASKGPVPTIKRTSPNQNILVSFMIL